MARLGAASEEVPRIDAALSAWRQGDLTLDSDWFIHAGDPARALTDEAAAVEEAGPTALTSEVAGLVVITQTCDIVRSCLERPFIEVCPLVEVDASRLREIERGRRPSYAYVPAVADRGLVADLDRVMTVEKSIASDWARTPGWTSDAQGRAFAAALARKRVRFAFPDDFTMFVGKLQSRLADKHDKNSEEGCALRALREQWNLELVDLRIDDPCPHVVVRFGSKGRSTKNKKIRRVPLMPAALALAKRWLRLLPAYASENAEGLVFPTPRGCRRQKAKTYGFKKHLALAGITRPVRWHDLRHTCASSLVAGWWGRPRRLEEVKEVLGHSSINVTERYAHLAPSVIARAAAETKIAGTADGKNWPTLSEDPSSPIADPAEFLRRAPPDSNGRPADSKSDALSS